VGGDRIRPGVRQRSETRTLFRDLVQNVQEITGRSGQPIQAGDEHHIIVVEAFQQAREFRAVGPGSADLLAEDLLG